MFEDLISKPRPCICTVGFDPMECDDYEALECEHPLFGKVKMCRWNYIELIADKGNGEVEYKSECMKIS